MMLYIYENFKINILEKEVSKGGVKENPQIKQKAID